MSHVPHAKTMVSKHLKLQTTEEIFLPSRTPSSCSSFSSPSNSKMKRTWTYQTLNINLSPDCWILRLLYRAEKFRENIYFESVIADKYKNTPYSYSRYWTGTNLQLRLMRVVSSNANNMPPPEPLEQASGMRFNEATRKQGISYSETQQSQHTNGNFLRSF